MNLVRKASFEAAHYLPDYEGPCRQIHGHSYKVTIIVGGKVRDDGMIIDFTVLKREINLLLALVDHQLLNELTHLSFASMPTVENIALWLGRSLTEELKRYNVTVEYLTVWETENSGAIAFKEDF